METAATGKELFGHVETDIGKKVLRDYPHVATLQGNLGMAMHILQGHIDGLPTRIFEYRHITGSGRSLREHHFSAIAFEFESIKPHTALRRHDSGDGLSKEDIVTGREAFDETFYVYADEWRLLSEHLPEELERTLMESSICDFVLANSHLVVVAPGRLNDVNSDRLLSEARKLAQWIKEKT